MALSTISGTTGITDATITSAKLADFSAAVDLNGVELLLDADQDTSITADTDDRIDFKIAGVEHISISNSSGDTIIKPMVNAKDIVFQQYDGNKILEINDGNYVAISGAAAGPGELRFYEDTDLGALYTGFKAGNATASVSYVLPLADGTDGYQLTTDGSGTLSWASAGTTLANDGNNRVVTGTGSGLNGEANLTFDGSTLAVTGAATVSGALTGSSTVQGTTITATTAFVPDASDGAALGTTALEFSDLFLADAAVISLGDDDDVTITHVHDTGILINSTNVIQFNDASQNIGAPSNAILDINATDEIELNATLVDINANVEISGTATTTGVHTFSATPVFPDGSLALADLDIDGGTDIGEAIVDADLFIIDNGAGGTNRKVTASRIKTYAATSGAVTGITSVLNTSLVLGRDADNDIDFTADNIITFRAAAVDQIKLIDNVFSPVADSDVDLGTSSLYFKDAYIDTITTTGAITASGIVTGTGFTAGSAVLAEAELELLDGLTAGTAIASKVVTTDGSIDTTGQRNLTITGELDAATLDISGAVDIAGASVLHGLLTQDGGVVFNEASADVDFRIEDNANANAFFVEGGASAGIPRIGIGTAAPVAELHTMCGGVGKSFFDSYDGNTGEIALRTSRNATVGGHGASNDGDGGRLKLYVSDGNSFEEAARIEMTTDAAAADGDVPGKISFYTTPDGTNSVSERMRITSAGIIGVGDTAPDASAGGLTLNQAALDTSILTFKSSDVAHGITDLAETDTYFRAFKSAAATGGLRLDSYTEGSLGIQITPQVTSVVTTKGTGGSAAAQVNVGLKGAGGGTGVGAVSADANLFGVLADSTLRFVVDQEGDLHYDGTTNATAWDTEEDAQLVRALDLSHGVNVIDSKFDKFVGYNHEKLAEMKLVGREEDGTPNHFVNITGLQRLHNGAIWQQYEKHQQLLEAVYDLAKVAVGEEKANAILDKHEVKRLN